MERGGILLSGHVGNWEIAGDLLKRLNTKINIVVFDAEHKWIKEYSNQVLFANYNLIVMKEDMSHVYEIGDALNRNELICLHADRFVDEAKTLEMEFFNQKALFPVGPFALAATFKVPVSFVFSFKETLRHYHFYGSPIIDFDPTLSKSEYIKYMATQFVQLFQKMVEKYPLQWFNYYKFEK
jgi:predicted LPLAT superfamily acyltransferase